MEFAYKLRQTEGMSTNAERFAEIVKQRRLELDYNQLELWAAGGPSNTTLTKIENAEMADLNRNTAKKLDAGLRWTKGSAKATWEGGDPTPIGDDVDSKDAEYLRRAIEEANIDAEMRRALLAALISNEPERTIDAPGKANA